MVHLQHSQSTHLQHQPTRLQVHKASKCIFILSINDDLIYSSSRQLSDSSADDDGRLLQLLHHLIRALFPWGDNRTVSMRGVKVITFIIDWRQTDKKISVCLKFMLTDTQFDMFLIRWLIRWENVRARTAMCLRKERLLRWYRALPVSGAAWMWDFQGF